MPLRHAAAATLLGVTLCASSVQADNRVFVEQATSVSRVTFVLQTSDIADRRRAPQADQASVGDTRSVVQPPSSADAQILELSVTGGPPLPDAHVSVD